MEEKYFPWRQPLQTNSAILIEVSNILLFALFHWITFHSSQTQKKNRITYSLYFLLKASASNRPFDIYFRFFFPIKF